MAIVPVAPAVAVAPSVAPSTAPSAVPLIAMPSSVVLREPLWDLCAEMKSVVCAFSEAIHVGLV